MALRCEKVARRAGISHRRPIAAGFEDGELVAPQSLPKAVWKLMMQCSQPQQVGQVRFDH